MANAQESALHYPLDQQLPPPGTTLELAPGVRWLRMALPFALDHINLWLLRDEQPSADSPGSPVQGWTIIDCGINDARTQASWEQIFAHDLDGLPVLRVIVTHMHPDHIGLAHWLCQRWSRGQSESGTTDCRLWISATDWNAARMASQATTGFGGEGAAAFFARHGLIDPDALQKVRARSNYYASMVPQVPGRFRRLMHGMVLKIGGRAWHCIAGYGHAPEHIALHCPQLNLLISGDMVLPRISTNVSVIDLEPEANPLPMYLDSISALRDLPAETLVLPSHGRPFTGLHTRIDQLHRHHRERLAEVLQACAEKPCHAAELLDVMFKRKLDLHQTTFAMGEAIAHLHALAETGQLLPVNDGSGVLRWRTAASGQYVS